MTINTDHLKHPLHEYTAITLVRLLDDRYRLIVYSHGDKWPSPNFEVLCEEKYYSGALMTEREWLKLVDAATKLLT